MIFWTQKLRFFYIGFPRRARYSLDSTRPSWERSAIADAEGAIPPGIAQAKGP
jgi:hypothetical protein